ncbi:hypothetical protein [Sorangium cellulosum]|uniref:hypothetical protein n=1 Tax=Sorangium cellulosum TaxID=56 RepID=UPI0011DDA361|nr:hypothetical protein [Sorangium cellulosum]
MITLGYSIEKAPPKNADLREVEDSDIHYDLFLGDIVFQVNGSDLSARWGWVPVLDFAVCLYRISESLRPGVCESFEFTESEHRIDFVLNGDIVEVRTTYGAPFVCVSHVELRASAKQFLRQVIDELESSYTTLRHNPFIRRLYPE